MPGDVEIAYYQWKLGFTKSGDCNLTDNMLYFPPLEILPDGSVNLSFTYIVTGECDNAQHECSSTFTKAPCINCETAYATLENENSRCFIEDGFSQWGWTNYIDADGQYVMNLYAGAAKCYYTEENYVGQAIVDYSGGILTVHYTIIKGFSLDKAHVNVGCDKYPLTKQGKQTVAPGQYTFKAENLDMLSELYVKFTGVSGPVWIIIHGETCDVQGEGSAEFDPIYMGIECNKVTPVVNPVTRTDNQINMSIFPNPFNTLANVKFSVPETGRVTLEVYNMTGVLVSRIYEGMASKDVEYKFEFSGSPELYQATYLVVLKTETGVKYQRLIMLR
jgi:hypothetical protein